MRIILSPAKQMHYDDNIGINDTGFPVFIEDAEKIKCCLQAKSYAELKKLWACNDKIAEQNVDRLSVMNLKSGLTPAILAYDGIA